MQDLVQSKICRSMVFAGTLVLAGCATAAMPVGSVSGADSALRQPTAAKADTRLIYAVNQAQDSIAVFRATTVGANANPIRQIANGLSNPTAIFVGKGRYLWVANAGNNTVVSYAPGGTSPKSTIATGIDFPTGITVDARGTVYVLNGGGGPGLGSISVYTKGQTSPSATMPLASPIVANGIAVDAWGDLFLSYNNPFGGSSPANGIEEIEAGSTTASDLGMRASGPSGFGALAVDRAGNIVVVDNGASAGGVDVFAPGQTTPSRTIAVPDGVVQSLSLAKGDRLLVLDVFHFSGGGGGGGGGSVSSARQEHRKADAPPSVSAGNNIEQLEYRGASVPTDRITGSSVGSIAAESPDAVP